MTRTRREVLGLFGAAGLAPLVGCGDGGGGDDVAAHPDAAGSGIDADPSACATIPAETAGPFPSDGTNGPNILTVDGVVRSDIRTSVGAASGTAAGVQLTLTLTLVDSAGECAPLAGRAIYLWHCDRDGAYSMYAGSAEAENYLRGVQETDAGGNATFVTVFPGCYPGRWPHMHFEIFDSLAEATDGASAGRISQLAFPESACDEIYAIAGYEQSATNLEPLSLQTDGVFADGADRQVAAVAADGAGYAATLRVGI